MNKEDLIFLASAIIYSSNEYLLNDCIDKAKYLYYNTHTSNNIINENINE